MTSIGLMSAARITMPEGRVDGLRDVGVATGDLRMDLTHSLTPRFIALDLAAGGMLGTRSTWRVWALR